MKTVRRKNTRTGRSVAAFRQALAENLYFVRGQDIYTASDNDIYMTLAYTVRDHLIERWQETVDARYKANAKTVVYLSAEYLLGRQLEKNLLYAGLTNVARQALADFGLDLERYLKLDPEPGLGNGGLGRLAACFLDSLATIDIPTIGYGIRYEFGIFNQVFEDGWQVEMPDKWLHLGYPWEFAHADEMVEVHFGGHTEGFTDEEGRYRVNWKWAETVLGEPYRSMVPGYKTKTVNMLRLWRARASREFDFQLFEEGDYTRAVEQKTYSENIYKVLYPNDNFPQGKELRLKQQYFFVACSLQDVIRLFRVQNQDLQALPDKIVIQLNDTHPVIAIPELMRILVDENGLPWEEAWKITTGVFASTQHTLLPEALEEWPVVLLERLLPRHLEIIYEINERFLQVVEQAFPGEPDRKARMSIVREGSQKHIRMAHLACVGSKSINGVAELQSKLLKERVFPDFYELWPEKFNNKTNGVTPRRFLRLANPKLSELIDEKIGDGWLNDLNQLSQLEEFVEEAAFQHRWRQVKRQNKEALAAYIQESLGLAVDANSIFDVMVKRLHEYKRQLLMALYIITMYQRIKGGAGEDIVPRTFIFGAKAAPGYYMAKLIIKLINSVAEVVNNDPEVKGRLKVVFLPNFNVSLAEKIYPAADISEQISLAGKEASGTGNMKFALNGAVTVGTLDGANIEIRDLVGDDNFFHFGLTDEQAFGMQEQGYLPLDYYHSDEELKQAIDAISLGDFSKGDQELFRPLVDSLLYRDEYMLLADYRSYIECQDRAASAYEDVDNWTRKSILNAARCGFFSSDRAMGQYCTDIWQVEPVDVP